MSFQNHMHRISGCDQIAVDERQSVFILVFQKSDAHFFLKEATEITGLEAGNVCNLIKRDGFFIMVCNIIQHRIQSSHFFLSLVDILLKYFHTEIMVQLK